MIELYSDVYGQILLQPLLPKGFKSYIIAGSEPYSYSGEAGQILIQQIVSSNYTIFFADYQFNSKTKITLHISGFVFQSYIVLNEDVNAYIDRTAHVKLRQGHFMLLQNPSREVTFLFEKGRKYFAFGSSYAPTFIDEYLNNFASFKKTYSKLREDQMTLITKTPRHAPRKILDDIYDILHCPYEGTWREKFIDNNVDDIFFLQLAEMYKEPARTTTVASYQQDALHEARRIILADLTKHYSNKELAKKVHLSSYFFKTGFKELFGIAPFECLIDARLNTAKRLLVETDKPLKEIARIVGYSRQSSFANAFNRHFNYTPGSLRK
ncbi:AraC family transcriptional regulator [Pinibacter soli]|uniref:AraC family transcriptional regulator n=1 Tax=Pinibacter soli TaxID=3044211 RepID=A0ABT6RFM6_9BACT|nr:AraC family transcriptional regulator [Pinibacter soli]MDI3321371.1 AraC family transcriptional regulator [Pinibacter soli]